MTGVTLSFDQLVYLQRASATVRSYLSFITTAKGCIAAHIERRRFTGFGKFGLIVGGLSRQCSCLLN